MKRIVLLFALALALCGSVPAHAAQVVLCASARESNSASRQVNVPPNLSKAYQADAQGCVVANGVADIAILRSAGYSEPGKERACIFSTGVATGTTSFLACTLPAGAYVQQLIYNNTTANSAGNISFGSTSGGSDIAAAAACGAACLIRVTDALLLKSVFSTSAPQAVYVTSSGWNSANVSITLIFGLF